MMKRLLMLFWISLAVVAWAASDTGVRVNRLVLGPTTSAAGQSPWKFSNNVLTLTGENTDYILSGKNLNGDVRVEVKANCLVTLEDFEIDVSSKPGQNAISVLGDHTLTLNLVGTSKLQGAVRGCGILVLPGNKLIVQSETGTGRLEAKGGAAAAGIGGEYYKPSGMGVLAVIGGSCGEVTILSGNVVATGGVGGAGIGGGGTYSDNPLSVGGNGGTVRIMGGNVVAFGGSGGAGIGGGQGFAYATFEGDDDFEIKGGDGGTVDIYGGSVTVRGGGGAAAIGGGQNGRGGTVRIHDGTVGFLSGGARDVGAGTWDRAPQLADNGTYQIRGGSISSSWTDFRPTNTSGLTLYQLEVPWPTRNASPILSDLTVDGKYYGYAMNKATTADESAYFIWLPSGEAQFAVGGAWYRATVRPSGSVLTKIETTLNAFGGRIVYWGKNDTSLTVGIYKPGDKYGDLPSGTNVTRSGYEFGGWYDDQGRRVVDSSIVPDASRSLTAKWLKPIDRGEAVGNSALKFSAYRNRPELTTCTWFGQSEVGYSNGNALRSGTIGHSATNVLQCIVTGPGTVSFRYKVSSEYDYDELRFHIASEPRRILLNESGEMGSWKLCTAEVPSGQQTLVWTYTKDHSNSVGEDCAWLDDIRYTPGTCSSYTIRYNANDGSGRTMTQSAAVGKAETLLYMSSQIGWSRSGYTFAGWGKTATATGVSWINGNKVKDLVAAGGTVNLYAIWKKTSEAYTVNYWKNDGTTAKAGQVLSVGETQPLIYMSSQLGWTRAGYTFAGWGKTATATTTAYINGQKVKDLAPAGKSVDLYAIWKKASEAYTVNYWKNDGTTAKAGQVLSVGETQPLIYMASQLGWTRAGYTFAGWGKTATATTTAYINGQKVKDLAAAGKSVDLYAIWKKTSEAYTINYYKNDGTTTKAGQVLSVGETQPLIYMSSQLGWTRSGYTFLGWSKSQTATTATYTNGEKVKGLAPAGKSVNLYAVWQKKAAAKISSVVSRTVARASVAMAPVPEVLAPGYYTGMLADGTGTYDLLVDEDGETGFVRIACNDGEVVAAEVELVLVGETILVRTEEEVFTLSRPL